jgi:hypothetical protein
MKKLFGPIVLVPAALAMLAGCSRGGGVRTADAAPARVDSARSMGQALAGFRQGLPAPAGLTGGEPSRGALVARFVRALERGDTADLVRMAVSRAEFAWLVYPTDPQSRPPYELEPGLMWFQAQTRNRTGVLRALRSFGGRPLRFAGYACDARPRVEGANRVWTGCRVHVAGPDGRPVSLRLFGAVLERGGRFKIQSYSNDL